MFALVARVVTGSKAKGLSQQMLASQVSEWITIDKQKYSKQIDAGIMYEYFMTCCVSSEI